jgi:glycosyltransferase involved in cell wall biosynthesis
VIAFDLQALQSAGSSERGIARFVLEVTRHLLAGPHADRVDLFLWNDRQEWSQRFDQLELGDRLRSFSEVAGRDVDILHVNSPFEMPNATDQFPPLRARRIVATCYDLIPYLFPDHYLFGRYASAAYRRRLGAIATADVVVTDSRSAADDVISVLGLAPSRVRVIGAGVSPEFQVPVEPLAERIAALRREWPSLRARYVLVPTAADWRKNSIGAIEAFASLPVDVRTRHQLVLFCRLTDGQRRKLEAVAADAGVADQVLFTGYVPDDLLIRLYQSAELVFVPTMYEGFGLPVLEARRCGARVICSNTSSLPEVLVDEGARFNPYDPDDVAATLQRALVDDRYAARLERVPAPEFEWDVAVDRVIDVYDELTSDLADTPARSTSRSGRRRIGVVGAMLPAHGGEVTMLRDDIIVPLAGDDRFEVTAYSVIHQPSVLLGAACPVRPFVELAADWESGALDDVVYVFGERPHRFLTASINNVPGHAIFLPGAAPSVAIDRARSVLRWDRAGADPIARLTASLLSAAASDATYASS